MTSGRAFATAALVAAVMLPLSAEAQNDNRNKGGRGSGNGPAFCRSGEGHPVHGRQWCRDKGWDVGGTSVFDRGRARERDRDRDARERQERDRDARDRFRWPF